MTNHEFAHIQDQVLQLSGRELAEKLGVVPSAITRWRKGPGEGGAEIPDYIQRLLTHLIREQLGSMELSLTMEDITGIIRLASARGQSFNAFLIDCIRRSLRQDDKKITPLPEPQARVADDETPYETKPKDLKGKQAG